MQLLRLHVGLNPGYTHPGRTKSKTSNAIVKVFIGLNPTYTPPGRTIWKTSHAIVKVLRWFEYK